MLRVYAGSIVNQDLGFSSAGYRAVPLPCYMIFPAPQSSPEEYSFSRSKNIAARSRGYLRYLKASQMALDK